MPSLMVASFLAAGVLALGGPASADPLAAQSEEPTEVLKAWRDQVDLLLTEQEKSEWERLETNADREAFIDGFWKRRDPTPGTPENEFRQIYMARVRAAERQFGREGMPGYKTDRGKVLIIYGPPREQELRPTAGGPRGEGFGFPTAGGQPGEPTPEVEVGGGPLRGRPDIIWRYEGSANPYLKDVERIRFVAVGERTYVLRTKVELSADAFLASIRDRLRARPAAGAGVAGRPGMAPEIVAAHQLLEQGAVREELALEHAVVYFPAPAQGGGMNTFTVVAFEVGKEDLTFAGPDEGAAAAAEGEARLRAFGVLRQEGAEGPRVLRQFSIDFAVPRSEGDAEETGTHSFGVTLVPGSYRLAWGVIDTASQRMTVVDQTLEVPDFGSGGLKLTSVLAARRMVPQEEPVNIDTVYPGIRLGNLLMDVDLDHEFAKEDTLSLLYFVMGVGFDPNTGQPKLEVSHRILRAEDQQSIARLPTQTLNYFAIGQDIPLSQVTQVTPGNSYEVEIHIKDLVSGQELTHRVPFTVVAAQEGA